MKDLAIYGGGGLGREIRVLADQINEEKKQFNVLGFFDDGQEKGRSIDGLEVLGGMETLNKWKKELHVVVSIADPDLRFKLAQSIQNKKILFPNLIHPTCIAYANARNTFGRGIILTAHVIMTTGIKLDDFVIVNLATTIGHDVKIGKFTSIMPSCSISGNVRIGERCFIGTGARILQNLTLGNNAVVGAGAVVTKSFGDRSVLMGVPAVRINDDEGN